MYKDVVDFIRGHYGQPEGFLSLHEPRFIGNERKYVIEAIDSTFVSSVGEFVNRFEKMMCEITGAKYAVATVNGTAALHIALKLAGVTRDCEVLSQPLTFIATANAISYEGAVPHFIDVDEQTLGMSAKALADRLSEIAEMRGDACFNKQTGRRIAACVPMHTFGLPCDIDGIIDICNAYKIPVVEDAAESLGSYYKGRHTGTFGLMGAYSFNGNKTVTCGGGGAIVTNDEALAKLAKHITTTAKVPHKWEFVHDRVAYNYRMPNLNAALACAQLEMLGEFIENKRKTAEAYQAFFKGKDIQYIGEPEHGKSNYWLNAVRLASLEERNAFLTYTNDAGVMTRPIWHLMHHLEMFKDSPKGDLSVSEALEQTIVNIPSSVVLWRSNP